MSEDQLKRLTDLENTVSWAYTYVSLITDSIELMLICLTILYISYVRNIHSN